MTEPERQRQNAVRVVIIDGHRLEADSVAALLEAGGDVSVVKVAGTYTEGLDAIDMHQPDVLLLDQRLLDGLGTDVLPALLDRSPAMRVLLVTADTNDEILTRAIEAGAAGVVPKGQRDEDLLRAVRAVRAAAKDEAVIAAEAMRRLLGRVGSRVPSARDK